MSFQRIIILVLLLVQFSCISKKKYGLHFQANRNTTFSKTQQDLLREKLTEDSIILSKVKELFEADSIQENSILPENQKEVSREISELRSLLLETDTSNVRDEDLPIPVATVQNKHEQIKESGDVRRTYKQKSYRKTEPFGIASLLLPLLYVFIAPPGIIPAAILSVIGLFLAEISLIRTKQKRGKWKGRGFGIAAAILNVGIFVLAAIASYVSIIIVGHI